MEPAAHESFNIRVEFAILFYALVHHRDLISHPQVLWAAWLRVAAWYDSSNHAPQPELSIWKLHPEAELRKLGQSLRDTSWQPSKWLQVPHPKKGQQLRHYWMPTVRDQVAFMAHMVLLGPLLDDKLSNFAFGNRWYRPIAWDRRKELGQWVLRSYPFFDKRTYQPYSRSHGLYRRVANWTVSRMIGAEIRQEDYSGPVPSIKDYRETDLPEWTKENWWPISEKMRRVHWATLDLQLAYPSVRIDRLKQALQRMLRSKSNSFPSIICDYPDVVIKELEDSDVRLKIASSLVSALNTVQGHDDRIPQDTWRPYHAEQRLPPCNPGLPTGLAISGMLLNVVLHCADRQIFKYLKLQKGEHRGAFLRFADDMTVLSQSASGLLALIDKVWQAVSGDNKAILALPESSSNLLLNVGKIKPERVKEVLIEYLHKYGWKKCEECKATIPGNTPNSPKTLKEWWADASDKPSLLSKLNQEAVGPHEMGPFVTTLVERLSEIGRDTLAERFGQGAHNRLTQLHELARWDIDDEQVRPDTRRAFAANRLVSAWLPANTAAARKDIEEIRDSIEYVLQETPWKHSLWRAVVRAAALRPVPDKNSNGQDEDQKRARRWLLRMLGRIALCSPPEESNEESYQPEIWAKTWPKIDHGNHHTDRSQKWCFLYLSYHRAAFWKALAGEIRNLQYHSNRTINVPAGWHAGPPPYLWAVRAIPEDIHGDVADFLADLDKWVGVLYPDDHGCNLSDSPWELDQFVATVLAATGRATLAKAWRHCQSPKNHLMIPDAVVRHTLPKTAKLLRNCKRVQPRDNETRKLSTSALAHIYLGSADDGLGNVLFPEDAPPTIDACPRGVAMMGIALGCSDHIPTCNLSKIVAKPAIVVKQIIDDPLKLREYGQARAVLMAKKDGLRAWHSDHPTLHRLLWGPEPCQELLERWRPRPWEIPAVGLTAALAIRLYVSAQSPCSIQGWEPRQGPLTWNLICGHKFLAAYRHQQLGLEEEVSIEETDLSKPRAIRSDLWEIPPHPAYFLPFVTGVEFDPQDFAMYCDVLLFLTAIDGSESILHGLARNGAGSVPFEDRWAWRSRIHLSAEIWRCVEKVIRWSNSPTESLSDSACEMRETLFPLDPGKLSLEQHYLERVDIRLDPLNDLEVVRAVTSQCSDTNALPENLKLNRKSLAENILVRMGQVARWPNDNSVVPLFPVMNPIAAREIMEQVASAFQSKSMATSGRKPEIVVLPEVCIPVSEAGTIRKLVEAEGCASLAGLYWRELRPVYPTALRSPVARRWLVNEAELVVPIGATDRGPTGSRWFRVRKPVPAHVETGLVRAISARTPGTQWHFLRGQRWHRFLHPQWGDFTVAICADLLDAVPWRTLRGELLHLFMVAFNKDVDLYESLTWVRAYETYVNLVAVNHGRYGGSTLWTPRRRYERELGQLRGKELFILADVEIPVRSLAESQMEGVSRAVCAAQCHWLGQDTKDTDFKAPPPGYRRRG